MSAGIRTQPAADLLEQVEEFYIGYLPWHHGAKRKNSGIDIIIQTACYGELVFG